VKFAKEKYPGGHGRHSKTRETKNVPRVGHEMGHLGSMLRSETKISESVAEKMGG